MAEMNDTKDAENNKTKDGEDFTCLECGTVFYLTEEEAKTYFNLDFCSAQCEADYNDEVKVNDIEDEDDENNIEDEEDENDDLEDAENEDDWVDDESDDESDV